MKISLNWLRDYVQLDASIDEISRAITFLGFEVHDIRYFYQNDLRFLKQFA